MKFLSALSVLAISLSACTGQSASAQKSNTTLDNSLVVAELFTSQGCSSCPAAESLFSKLADREDLLTLEWHVDYWDDLVHHGSRWKDPYSKRSFTARQRSYNRSLRGTSAVYTPQAIINGHFEGVGSRPAAVNDMLENSPAHSIAVKVTDNKVIVGSASDKADIVFLRLLERHETNVKGGENKGRKLHGRNIVLETSVIGKSGPKSVELTLPSISEGEACAVIVQKKDKEGDFSSILGATKC